MKKNPWKAATFVLTAVLGGMLGYQSIPNAYAGRQPHMESALKALNNALAELKSADPDKGGFREKAIGTVGTAISQTQEGINYANSH